MERTRKIAVILTLAAAFCFVLVSLPQADPGKKKVPKIPIWQITKEGTAKSVNWKDHKPNPRFAIYAAGTPDEEGDDLVLDRETGLVWARDANLAGETKTWQEAVVYCRRLNIGNRKGWRLPTVEELASLIDPSQPGSPKLPSGHPFINPQPHYYWSSTTYEADSNGAWGVRMGFGGVEYDFKTNSFYVWPVRGGSGPVLVPHTP